ncbi:uncharacterized protein [Haliotis cracherodii]|uniref:uncharacterized protein n=1 Tax=Haliotis cracherodii TaxID=6455 RepID=UPI0039E89AF1
MTDTTRMGEESTVTCLRGCYSFGPAIKHSGESFMEILDYFKSLQEEEKGINFTLFPPSFEQELQENQLHITDTVRQYLVANKGGVAFFHKSLSNLVALKTPTDVICDVIILTPTDVPYLLTITKDKKASRSYNQAMAKLVLRNLRLFVSVDFTLAFGVVGLESNIVDLKLFSEQLKLVKSASTAFALKTYKIMTNSKYESLVRGLVAMFAIAKAPTENGFHGNNCKHNSKVIWLMQKDAFKTMFAVG